MNELTTLSTLVIKGNAINEQMLFHGGQYVIYAAQLGQVLEQIKITENIKTNADFSEFLSREMPTVDRSKANRYIQISKQFPELLDVAGAPVRLSYTHVQELLSAPEDLKNEIVERIESGEDISKREIQRLKKEAAELLAEKQAVQNDLIEKEKRLDWLELDKESTRKQNDELRNSLAFEVDKRATEKLELERAKLNPKPPYFFVGFNVSRNKNKHKRNAVCVK